MPRQTANFLGRKAPHFFRQWRLHRHLTQDQMVARLIEMSAPGVPKTAASLSRLENGKQPYSQPVLEAFADVLQTDAGSLLMRNPLDPEAMWSIWDHASQGQRDQITRVAEALVEYKAEPMDFEPKLRRK